MKRCLSVKRCLSAIVIAALAAVLAVVLAAAPADAAESMIAADSVDETVVDPGTVAAPGSLYGAPCVSALALVLAVAAQDGRDQRAEAVELLEGLGEDMREIYDILRQITQYLLFYLPRTAHDTNLRSIDTALEMYRLVEGEEPSDIGNPGEPGTLVGENYLDRNPPIPFGLRETEGPWSAYYLGGDPLKAHPVGNWGGYRSESY